MDWCYLQQPDGKDLCLDLDLTRGQVRRVNYDWVETVQAGMEDDPPKVLDMIVWRKQGVQSTSPLPLPLPRVCLAA
jgi:hypothetical protein